jgi:Zn-dependent protease
MENINLLYLAVVFGSILVSMTLHEAMHAFASHWLGDDTAKLEGRLTLNPLSHIDPFTTVLLPLMLAAIGAPPFGAAKPVPFNPNRVKYGEWGAALVGVAGPLTNLVLAAIAGLIIRSIAPDANGILFNVLQTFLIVNISFFVFNMIPFPPLDGSRVLYAIAPDPLRDLMERIESMGFMAIVFFMLLFYTLLSEPFIRLIGYLVSLLSGYSIL